MIVRGNNPDSDEPAGHYVYVYKDMKGKVRYVGYGKELGRPLSPNHNVNVIEF